MKEFIEFYHFICENNPLLLNYVDLIDKADKNDDALKVLQKEQNDFIQVISKFTLKYPKLEGLVLESD